jgi:hypothetical protein
MLDGDTSDIGKGHRRQVRDVSDGLLKKLRELKDLEAYKRRLDIGSREFDRLAGEIADKSREIFDLAHAEKAAGDRIDEPKGIAIEDVQLDR